MAQTLLVFSGGGPGLESAPGNRFTLQEEEKEQGMLNESTHQLGLLEGVLSFRPKSDLRLNSEKKEMRL